MLGLTVQDRVFRQLEAVVTAMRGIAASRAQQSRSPLGGIEAYTDVISRTIGRALSLLSPDFSKRPVNPPHLWALNFPQF